MDRRTSSGAAVSHPHLVRSPYHPPTLPTLHQQAAAKEAERRQGGRESALRPRGAESRERSRSASQSATHRYQRGPIPPTVRSPIIPPQAVMSSSSTSTSPEAYSQTFSPSPLGGSRRGSAADHGRSGSGPTGGYIPHGNVSSSFSNFLPGQPYGPQLYEPTPPQSRQASVDSGKALRSGKSSNDLGRKVKSIFKDLFKRDLQDHDNGQSVQSAHHWSDEW